MIELFLKDCFFVFGTLFWCYNNKKYSVVWIPFSSRFIAFAMPVILTGFSTYRQSSSTPSFYMNCDSENIFRYFLLRRYRSYSYFCMLNNDLAGYKIIGSRRFCIKTVEVLLYSLPWLGPYQAGLKFPLCRNTCRSPCVLVAFSYHWKWKQSGTD